MKENKGKEVVNEAVGQEAPPHSHPSVGDKRKNLSLGVDLGNLPSRCREKKVKHKSSKPKDVQSTPIPVHEPEDVQILDSEPKDSPMQAPSTVKAPSSSQPSHQVPQHLIGNEDLAWERFRMAVTDANVIACYDMSLKDFEHSGVHDLFKVCILSLSFFCLVLFDKIPNKNLDSGYVQVHCCVQASN